MLRKKKLTRHAMMLDRAGRVSFNGGVGISLEGGGHASIEDNDLRNNAKGSVVVGASSRDAVTLGSNLT